MASAVEATRIIGPPKLHFAVALAIVKKKPTDRPVKDYILQIRGLIKNIKECNVVFDDKFFDSTRFWQSAFEKSQAEQTKLMDKIYELEQRNQALLVKAHGSQSIDTESPNSMKRKAAAIEENGTGTETAKKRTRGRMTEVLSPTDLRLKRDETNLDSIDFEPLSLMRPLYTLQRGLQNKRSNATLAMDAVTLCKAAERELLAAVLFKSGASTGPSKEKAKEPGLIVIVKAVELAFQLVHRALHRVAGAKSDTKLKGQITYYLVCLFESTMTALTQHCAVMGKSVLSNGKQSSADDGAETAQSLTNLLCTMTLSLELARPEDKEVMEGFLFVALDRVGKLLALFTFSDWRSPAEICPNMRPSGLTAVEKEDLTPDIAQVEAKHLLIVLDKVLTRESGISDAKSRIIHSLKDRLRKSLLQAVFGDDDPLFKEGLTRPATPPPQACETRQPDETEFSEWFIQGLWRLVGWDMLRSLVNTR